MLLSINQEAIKLLEANNYEASFKLFSKAVEVSRDVQSLTNLAWVYCYEEFNDNKALPLLEDAITMNPTSHFPYNLLGEIYIRQEKLRNAKDVLQRSIDIHPSMNAYNNLAVAHYHLGEIKEASNYFLLATEGSDYSMYSHVYCLIQLGETDMAKEKLDAFSEADEEFVGEVFVADLYLELGLFKEAAEWYEKSWNVFWKSTDWVSHCIYTLIKIGKTELAKDRLEEVIKEKEQRIQEEIKEEVDELWTEAEKQEYIKELNEEKSEYVQMFERMTNGFIPKVKFETSLRTACYLFGCIRHKHPEYID